MKMKKMVRTVLASLVILGGMQVMAHAETSEQFEIKSYEVGYNNGEVVNYTNGSYTYSDESRGIYEFVPTELGDWSFECESKEKLDEVVADYKEFKDTENVIEDFYVTGGVKADDGSYVVNFNDGSYIKYDLGCHSYVFMPNITKNKHEIKVNSMIELSHIVLTYQSIKMYGYY